MDSWHPHLVGLLLVAVALPAHAASEPDAGEKPTASTSVTAEPHPWEFSLSASGYFFTNQSDYVLPVLAVDHGWLHLEARYNYEARQAASVWVGWNFEWGEALTFSLTPILGVVFGDLNGIGIGAEWALAWGPLELSSQNEFLLDLDDTSQSYFYSWSELTVRPWEWLRFGLALQRTRAHASPRELQWGPMIGFSFWKLDLAGYYFNPGQSDAQYWVATLAVKF